MSKEYVVRDPDGVRILHSIQCDGRGCGEEIKPNPNISSSGWIVRGTDHGPGTDKLEWHFCPKCGET